MKNIRLVLQDELNSKFDINSNGCWIWNREVDVGGYGVFPTNKRRKEIKDFFADYKYSISAHKASYLAFRGPIPPKQLVLHTCNSKHCINPHHLYLGTRLDAAIKTKASGHWANIAKFKPKSEEIQFGIRARILGGKSFYSIAKHYNMPIQSIRVHATALEKQMGTQLPQRNKKVDIPTNTKDK